MKKTLFPLLLVIFGVLEGCGEKQSLHRITADGKVLGDNSLIHNKICIYLLNGKKIEKKCLDGKFYAGYLKAVNASSGRISYEYPPEPTERIGIALYKDKWSSETTNHDYNHYLDQHLWLLLKEMEEKGIRILDEDLIYKQESHWDPLGKVWLESNRYVPALDKGLFTEQVEGYPRRAFSFDPKCIQKIELRGE